MSVEIEQQALFDYAVLDTDTRAFVQEQEAELEGVLRRTSREIGEILLKVKQRLPHGQYIPWLASRGISRTTAWRCTQIALDKETDKCFKVEHLPSVESVEMSAIRETEPELQQENLTPQQFFDAIAPGFTDEQQDTYEYRYNPEIHSAYCKYCYNTHRNWIIFGDVFPGDHVWECQECDHRTKDEFMQIRPDVVEESDEESEEDTGNSIDSPLPPEFGLVSGQPFTMPLPDGKPVDIPESWKLPAEMRGEPPVKSATLAALQSSESNEWFTPALYVDAARELMGGIDTDPASNELANNVVRASTYYDIDTNGLDKEWTGSVWLNPPYGFTDGRSNQEVWTNRLIEQFTSGVTTEAVLLVNANTEAKWFQPLYDYLICFTNHRIRFYNQSGDSSQPTQGNALVYFGSQKRRFVELFSRFGRVVREVKADEY